MTIYNLYIFDKMGTLMHYAEWNRTKKSGITREEVGSSTLKAMSTKENYNLFTLFISLGSETYIWHAILYQIFCKQNIATRSTRGISILQNKSLCSALSGNALRTKVNNIGNLPLLIAINYLYLCYTC